MIQKKNPQVNYLIKALYCGKPHKLMAEYSTELFSASTHSPLSIFYG